MKTKTKLYIWIALLFLTTVTTLGASIGLSGALGANQTASESVTTSTQAPRLTLRETEVKLVVGK